MAEISAKDVMELRARTNAGMMDAKKALVEASGDMEAAGELLRKWGAGRAESKTSNEMKEGLVGDKISLATQTHHDAQFAVLADFSADQALFHLIGRFAFRPAGPPFTQ